MKHSLFFISLAAALAALCSCGKDTKTPDIHDLDPDDIFITSTSLSPAGPLTMYVGESVTITASYEPADATLTDLLWKNGDEKVLEMVPSQDSRSVTVKAISAGEAVLLLNAPLPSDGSIINSGSSIWITVIRPRSDEVAESLLSHTQVCSKIISDTSWTVVDGLEYIHVDYLDEDGKPMKLFAYEADLTEDIKLMATSADGDKSFGTRQALSKQAESREQADGVTVYGAVNADFFLWSGKPYGPYWHNGKCFKDEFTAVTTDPLQYYTYCICVLNDNTVAFIHKNDYALYSTSIKECVGGYLTPLVENGNVCYINNPDIAPRTMIGRSSNGKKVWLAVVDGRSASWSNGATLMEGGYIMHALGAWDVQNLDGGGSSEIIMKKDGAFEVLNHPSDGSERLIADGLAITGAVRQPTQ
mgnify:CR=1 FL=1